HHRRKRRAGAGPAQALRSALPPVKRPQTNGQALQDCPGEAQAEVRGAQVQPLPAVRAAAGVSPQVPDVPDLPAQPRTGRRGDGAHQELLVTTARPRARTLRTSTPGMGPGRAGGTAARGRTTRSLEAPARRPAAGRRTKEEQTCQSTIPSATC